MPLLEAYHEGAPQMEKMAIAFINGDLLKWARERAKLTHAEVAGSAMSADQIRSWESKFTYPTFPQADQVAARLGIPLLVLFLDAPPVDNLPLPDLRTVSGRKPVKPSLNFLEVINDALVRQDWYREENPNEKPRILRTAFSVETKVGEVAEYLRKRILGINNDMRAQYGNFDEFLCALVERAEDAGVLVMRSSIVRHDTRRKLDVNEFRGFALADPIAPVIFINTNDPTSAQIFTLAHELAHICIGQDGVSNPDPTKGSNQFRSEIEVFCNAVAAEVLAPTDSFERAWQSTLTVDQNLKRAMRFYKISKLVALRRAYDLEKIDSKYFLPAARIQYNRDLSDKHEERGEGADFWNIFTSRNSKKLTLKVVDAFRGVRIAPTEAASLLGVKVTTLDAFADQSIAS